MTAYKEQIKEYWTSTGGLITKATAAKILGVNRSVITKNKTIKTYKVENDEFVSFVEIINNEEIKPRKKRKEEKKKK